MLINVYTGKSASDDVKDFLLTIPEKGRERYEKFKEECIADPGRFEKRISKVKLHTFQREGACNV